MRLRSRIDAYIASQLGHPSGIVGRVLSRGLNRGNRELFDGAVAALSPAPDAVVADVGFGGGIGLRLLLDRPGSPTVHGVEISATMIAQAQSLFAAECSAGRVHIHKGALTDLPLESESLDGLITVNTIYFVDDLDLAFREIARTLRSTGRAVIGIGDPQRMEKMSFTAQGFRLRPVSDIETALARAGLELVDHPRVGKGRIPAHLLIAAPSTG
ncbi:MAG: class I SAM-dependent methyltransferase [Solirubrobacteraceae bacterium]